MTHLHQYARNSSYLKKKKTVLDLYATRGNIFSCTIAQIIITQLTIDKKLMWKIFKCALP